MFSIPFLIDFGSLLGRFLEGFGPQVECQVYQKIDHTASCWQVGKNSKKTKKMFFKVFGPLGRPTSTFPERSKIKQQKISTSWPNFWSIFGPTCVDFGRILASKLEPSWVQMPLKSDPKTNQKNDCFLEGFQVDFGWIWLHLGTQGGVTWNAVWVSWGVLGPSGGQDGPQDGPKRPQEAPQTTPRPILLRF